MEAEPKKGVFDLKTKSIFSQAKWEPKSNNSRLLKPLPRRVKRIVKQEQKLQEETRDHSNDQSGYDFFLNRSGYRLGDLESIYQPLDLPEISERQELCKCGKRKKRNHTKRKASVSFHPLPEEQQRTKINISSSKTPMDYELSQDKMFASFANGKTAGWI